MQEGGLPVATVTGTGRKPGPRLPPYFYVACDNNNGSGIIMSTRVMALVWPLQMPPAKKSILISLADNCNDTGYCYPSISYISKRTCLNIRTVMRGIDWLADNNYLHKIEDAGKNNRYELNLKLYHILVTESHHTLVTESHPCQKVTSDRESHTSDRESPELVTESHPNRHRTVNNRHIPDSFKFNKKVRLPEGFCITERVRVWAKKKGYTRLDEHLENFCMTSSARGYKYADWDAAFMNAIRKDWANLGGTMPDPGEGAI